MWTDRKSLAVGDGTSCPASRRLSGREALLLSLRAAGAGTVAFVCYHWTRLPGLSWAPISAVLVMEPSLRPSMRLSLIRFAGNLVGVVCGACGSLFFGAVPLAVAISLLATGTLCHYARLDDGRRPAYVAMLIVLTNNAGGGVLGNVVDRIIAVVLGCVVALLVAFVFELVLGKFSRPSGDVDTGE